MTFEYFIRIRTCHTQRTDSPKPYHLQSKIRRMLIQQTKPYIWLEGYS